MRILIAAALLLSLASCTTPSVTPTTPTTQTSTGVAASTGSLVTLNYTLRTDSETGPIQETTLQTVAEGAGFHKSGATYKPFQVALGQNQVIYGFEKGLMGAKKGEKKIIKVIPSEGYGRPITLDKAQIAPEFSLTRDKKMFDSTITDTMEKSKFPSDMQAKIAAAKVGETLTGSNDATAKVIAITDTTITLAIENTGNPFYKKDIKVGAVATTADADFKITAITDTTVTVDIVNKKSPFYNKKFAVGESITPQNGSKITIQEIADTTVTILADHPFMAKDLYFDVEIVDVQ